MCVAGTSQCPIELKFRSKNDNQKLHIIIKIIVNLKWPQAIGGLSIFANVPNMGIK